GSLHPFALGRDRKVRIDVRRLDGEGEDRGNKNEKGEDDHHQGDEEDPFPLFQAYPSFLRKLRAAIHFPIPGHLSSDGRLVWNHTGSSVSGPGIYISLSSVKSVIIFF